MIADNGNLSRCEFHTRALTRYGVNRRQANAIYDSLDTNRDDEVSSEDIDVTVADYNGASVSLDIDRKLTA